MSDFYKGKRVLVTGGTGLIGRPLVELLLQAGAIVRVVSLDNESRCPEGVKTFLVLDLTDDLACSFAVEDMDYVFHVAGTKGSVGIGVSRAATFMVPPLLMNTNLMEAARKAGVKHYLFTSSLAVYPPSELFVESECTVGNGWGGPPHFSDRYAAWMKRIGELQAEAYREEYDWQGITIVRPANVMGPWDNFDPKSAMAVASLIRRVVDGEDPLVVWGDGSAKRDFIYSEDVARGMMLVMEKADNNFSVNLGSGRATSIKELVETICSLVPRPSKVVWDTSKPTGESVRLMDITRAKSLGFEPQVSLWEGLERTIKWYLGNKEMANRRYNAFAD